MARMKMDSVQLDKKLDQLFQVNSYSQSVVKWPKTYRCCFLLDKTIISLFRVPRLTKDGRDHLLIISAKIWPKNVQHKNNIPSISFPFIYITRPTTDKILTLVQITIGTPVKSTRQLFCMPIPYRGNEAELDWRYQHIWWASFWLMFGFLVY